MFEKKTPSIDVKDAIKGQVYWSEYFDQPVRFIGRDEDGDYEFELIGKENNCYIENTPLIELTGLFKELF